MAATINVNDRTVVHKSSDGVSIAFPDVCKTPSPAGPIPIPYPNIAMSADTADGSKSVKMDKNPIMLQGSVFSKSTGDEAGTAGGGIISAKTKGKAEFMNYSFDVTVEGKGVPRLADLMVQNKGSPANTPPIQEVQPPLPPAVEANCEADEVEPTEPCDYKSITISNNIDKDTDTQKVFCTTRARNDCNVSKEDMALLGGFDLLLECMADYENNYGVEPSKKANIKIEVEKKTNADCCVTKFHDSIMITPLKNLDASDFIPRYFPTIVSGKSVEYKDLTAPSIRRDSGREQGWLARFWSFNNSEKMFDVSVGSCGIVEEGSANIGFRALVKIYPQQTWKLSLKIPPFKKISKSRSGSLNTKGDLESQTSKKFSRLSKGHSDIEKTSRNLRTGDNIHTLEETTTSGKATDSFSYSAINKGGVATEKTVETESRQSNSFFPMGSIGTMDYTTETGKEDTLSSASALKVKPNVTLTINGHSLAITDRINNIINIAQLIRDTWNELQNWAPKVGWSASLDIAFLEGTISGEWGYRASEVVTSRIARVEPYYTLSVDVKLFECKMAVSFGVDVKVENWFTGKPLVELVVALQGSIICSLSLEAEYTSGTHSQKPGSMPGRSKAEIKAVARASVLDVVYEATISMDGGIAIDAEFKCGFKQDPVVDAKIYSLPIEVKMLLRRDNQDDYVKKIPILPKKDIWSGQYPSPN